MIPRSQWADAAILYLSDPLDTLMKRQRTSRREAGGSVIWRWEDFLESLYQVLDERDSRSSIQIFLKDHPLASAAVTVAGASLVATGSLILAPAVIVRGLNVVGFTASGVAAGSIAATMQGSVYGGLTTGLFSTCQSIGTTWVAGSASSIISGVGSLVAGATVLSASQKEIRTNSSAAHSDMAGSDRIAHPPQYR